MSPLVENMYEFVFIQKRTHAQRPKFTHHTVLDYIFIFVQFVWLLVSGFSYVVFDFVRFSLCVSHVIFIEGGLATRTYVLFQFDKYKFFAIEFCLLHFIFGRLLLLFSGCGCFINAQLPIHTTLFISIFTENILNCLMCSF